MSCPYCEEFKRRGIDEPIQALEHQMLINNIYVDIVVQTLGYERAKEIAEKVLAIAAAAQKQGLQ